MEHIQTVFHSNMLFFGIFEGPFDHSQLFPSKKKLCFPYLSIRQSAFFT